MTKRLVALFGTAVILLAACQAATPSGPTETGPAESGAAATGGGLAADQVLNIYGNMSEDPRSLEPQAASGSDEILILLQLQRGLLAYDKDLNLVPSLAAALPEVTDGGQTVTFKLRDAKYSNGEDIVAGDLVRAFRRLADPRNAFDYGYEMCWLVGANEVMGEDFGCDGVTPDVTNDALIDGLLEKLGAEAPDPKTFVVRLAKPVNFIQSILGMWLTVPVQESWTSFAEATDLVSSGPFMMESWTHNSEMVLVPNPNWYGTKPTLTKIVVHIGGDPETAVAAYEAGTLDMVWVPGTSIRRVVDDPALKDQVKDFPNLGNDYYDFANCDVEGKCPPSSATKDGKSPSANRNFRIALTQAVDKKELIDIAFGGIGTPATSSVMPGIPGWPDDYDPYPFNVDAAKAALQTALDEMGIVADPPDLTADPPCDAACQSVARVHKLGRLKFGYNCNGGHESRVFYLYDTWRNTLGFAGSQFDISCTDFGTFRTERRAGNVYDIQRNGWGADFAHPDNQLRDLFACGAGNNNNGYCNPQFDELLDQGAAEFDPAASHDLYVKAQRLLVDDAAVLFMRWQTNRFLIKPYVQGLFQTAKDTYVPGEYFLESVQILEH